MLRGSCSLVISSAEFMDFESIDAMVGIEPTKTVERGQIVGGGEAPINIWRYELKIYNESPDEVLSKLLSIFVKRRLEIQTLKQMYDTRIDLFIRSDYGQMGYTLSSNVLSKLAKINLSLETHILSFGGA